MQEDFTVKEVVIVVDLESVEDATDYSATLATV